MRSGGRFGPAWLLVALLGACSCGDGARRSPGQGDASAEAGAGGARSEAGAGGGGAPAGGGTSPDGASDAGAPGSAGGSAGSAPGNGGTQSGGADGASDAAESRWPASPPPVGCYPSCIWDLVKECVTGVNSCVMQQVSDDVLVMCDPNTGWRRVLDRARPGYEDFTAVTRNGDPCYSFYRYAIDGVTYYADDRTHRFVAAVTRAGAQWSALCASGGADGTPVTYPDPPERYDSEQPQCAPWALPDCVYGTCP